MNNNDVLKSFSKINVYVELNENKIIKRIESSISSSYLDFTDWIKIDEGVGDKYALAQNNYLEKGLIDNNGRYNYKYDTALVELTEEEKNILFPPIEPPIDPKDILIAELSISLAETQAQGAQAIAELTEAIAMLQIPTV